MNLDTKRLMIFGIGAMYFVSSWLLTIGYFTPEMLWRHAYDDGDQYSYGNYHHDGCTIGLLYSWCGESSYVLTNTLIMLSVGLGVKYISVAMVGLGIFFDLWKYTLFMTMLSLMFGVIYPAAGILIIVACIYVGVHFAFTTKVVTMGYSSILCIIAGSLMIAIFISLVVYDQLYVRQRAQLSKKQRQASVHKPAPKEMDTPTTTHSITPTEENDQKHILRQNKPKSVGTKIFKRMDEVGGLRRL